MRLAMLRNGNGATDSAPALRCAVRVAGCYVAVNRQTNEPVAVARDPLKLAAEVRRRDLHGVAVVYARYPDELELVGPG